MNNYANEASINVSNDMMLQNFWRWLLTPFLIGLMTLSHIPGLSKIMILLGMGFVWFFSIFYFFYYKLTLPVEVFIYFGWITWSLGGWFIASDQTLYLISLMTILQMGAMIFLVVGNMILYKNLSIVMFAIAIGGILVALSIYYTGEYRLSNEFESGLRATGITRNANSFAYHLIFVIFAMFYFAKIKSSLWWLIFQFAIIIVTIIGIILSGSRKVFSAALGFLILWFLFCQGKKIFKKPIITIFILIILIGVIYFTTDYVMSYTYLGNRFESRDMERGSAARIQMYLDGLNMLKKSPIWGVGLNNFQIFSTSGMYSHSDYMEVLANTGIIGFILYFSIYVVLWHRLNRIGAISKDAQLLYTIGLLKAAIITILFLGFGMPHITSKLTWCFLAAAVGYSWAIEQTLISTIHSQ